MRFIALALIGAGFGACPKNVEDREFYSE